MNYSPEAQKLLQFSDNKIMGTLCTKFSICVKITIDSC